MHLGVRIVVRDGNERKRQRKEVKMGEGA